MTLVLQLHTQGVRGREQYECLNQTSKNNVKVTICVVPYDGNSHLGCGNAYLGSYDKVATKCPQPIDDNQP